MVCDKVCVKDGGGQSVCERWCVQEEAGGGGGGAPGIQNQTPHKVVGTYIYVYIYR